MGGYIPATPAQQQDMLHAIGMRQMEDLFADIPPQLRAGTLALPAGKSEYSVRRILEGFAAENTVFQTIFRGAGAYRHYIPAIVKQVVAKESFVTAYTPYQAEISQGILQMIFEYQSEVCALTGMDVSNASLYDGASAAAEAAAMCRERARTGVLVAASAHPDTIAVMRTYAASAGAPFALVPQASGKTDLAALQEMLSPQVACLYLPSPNYYGVIEDVAPLADACHAAGVKLILGCHPIALGLLQTPAALGADIAVGEGQPLGLPLSFGGPYLGFIACRAELMRRLPGRIAGETTDADGRRCFVLTLQAREQHIRREKASSSVCTNQALCAMAATVYLAAMGPEGLAQAARQCYAKAHYAAAQLAAAGYVRRHTGEFFNEFVTASPADPAVLMARLESDGILGGLPLPGGDILWCCTEVNTKEEIDHMAAVAKEVAAL